MGFFSTIGLIFAFLVMLVLAAAVIAGIGILLFIVVIGPAIVLINKIRGESFEQ